MKLDEEFERGRDHTFLTDDEENQAELVHPDDDDGGENSDSSYPSPQQFSDSDNALDDPNSAWPKSYRRSMDMLTGMTPPNISFMPGTSHQRLFGSTISASTCKRRQGSTVDSFSSSASKPLLPQSSLDKEEVPRSNLPVKVANPSQIKLSVTDLPSTQENHCSFSQSCLNGFNVLCGVGILTMPFAIKEGGWLGLFVLLLFGIITCYTGILMKRCLESSSGLRTYPDIGQAAFGTPGRLIISILLYIELYAACVEYIIMMSDNFSTIFPNTHLNIAGVVSLDPTQIFAIVATIIVLPTVWLRDLSLLSYISVGGVLSSILLVLCLLWVGVVDGVGFHPRGQSLNLANLSVAIGIYGFGYSGHSVFPNIYSSMKEPSKFPLVLITCFISCTFLYIGVAVCGYTMFGNAIQSQFTLNMPKQYAASEIAVWTAVVTPMSKYALTITPVVLSVEELMPSSKRRSYRVSILFRTILVLSTLFVALTVPFFAILAALIGSFVAMLVALIFPCLCYLSILRGRLTKAQIGICIVIVVVGFVSGCCGTYSAIQRLAGNLAA